MTVNLELRELIAPIKLYLQDKKFHVFMDYKGNVYSAQGSSVFEAMEVLEEVLLEEMMQ